jgi:hypothetical protein
MPEMISIRKFDLATTLGHMIHFNAGVPVFVPDEVVPQAMGAGCVPVSDVDKSVFDSIQRAKVQFTGDLRSSLLHLMLDEIVRRNNAKDFDGSGTPKHEVLSQKLHFEVFKDETQKAFQSYMSARKRGEDVPLHKDAAVAMRVIEAESNSDLVAIAMEIGYEKKNAEGLKTKDLRQMLLSKLVA